MPTKKPVKKRKLVKFNAQKYAKAEKALARKWARFIHEAQEWLDELDVNDAPEHRGGLIDDRFETVYNMASNFSDMLSQLPSLLPDWD